MNSKIIKIILSNQVQILENQQKLLKEVRNQYNPEHSTANQLLCTKLDNSVKETEESIKNTLDVMP